MIVLLIVALVLVVGGAVFAVQAKKRRDSELDKLAHLFAQRSRPICPVCDEEWTKTLDDWHREHSR